VSGPSPNILVLPFGSQSLTVTSPQQTKLPLSSLTMARASLSPRSAFYQAGLLALVPGLMMPRSAAACARPVGRPSVSPTLLAHPTEFRCRLRRR
jgi:hypothetical protein